MAVRDITTRLDNKIIFNEVLTDDTETDGVIIDTADFELGITFIFAITAFSAGSFEFQIFESDADDMAGEVAVDSDKLIGTLPTLTALTADNTSIDGVGVFSNLRYLRVKVVPDSASGNNSVLGFAVQESEFQPTI
jgi:hypothetical protein